jgi:hypothetical protein
MQEPRRSWFMLLILAQQRLLLMHFVSAGITFMNGHYHDWYVPNGGSAFIFVDQIWNQPSLRASVFLTLAL